MLPRHWARSALSTLAVTTLVAACAGSDSASTSDNTTAPSSEATTSSVDSTVAVSTTAAAPSTDDGAEVPPADGAPPPLDFTLDEFVERWEAGSVGDTNNELIVDSIATPPPEEQFSDAWTETILLGATPLGRVGVAALADSQLVIDVNYLLPVPPTPELAEVFYDGLLLAMMVVDPLLDVNAAASLLRESGIAQQSEVDSYANEVEANGILHCFVISEGRSGLGYRAGSAAVGTLCQQSPAPAPVEGA